ncbi:DNA polymerase III subunit alpha [Escherichia coli]|uniref:DNA polymerase III subunit alpha n=1 Tax=Escherichia coli TaxID=562 RepID=A0A485JJN1_ECOLX|nr:DNA polymerase III subunit alpha [Escherichia coli]
MRLLGDELTHLTVLAANNTGYQNLTLLISKAYQRGYGAAGPIIDRDWLIELNEGLILLPAGAWATSDAVFCVVTARW